jgi:hypothetical protein
MLEDQPKRVYTKDMHQEAVAVVQTTLNTLSKFAKEHGLTTTDELIVLTGALENGSTFEMKHTAPDPNMQMRFYTIEVFDQNGSRFFGYSIQFQEDTGRVDDSTKFSPKGLYLGGHIQCWHGFEPDEEATRQLITLKMQGKDWKLIPYDQSLMKKTELHYPPVE